MIYTSAFTIISLLFGVHFYKSRYPQDFDTVILNISANIQQNESLKPFLPFLTSLAYYTIYVYSFCQILFFKTINFCIPYINVAVKKIFNAISKPGIELKTEPLQNVTELKPIILTPLDTSDGKLVLIKSPTNDVIILDKMPDNLDDLKYEVSDIRFLALYLKHNLSENHIIDLYNNSANYYVVGNKLDSEFFKYYLRNVLNVKLDNDKPFEYKLELMDHNVNMIYVNETESIVIEKDGYKILSEAKSETISEVKEVEEAIESEVKEVEEAIDSEAKSEAISETKAEALKEELEAEALEVESKEIKEEVYVFDASTICY
jgi:hypothetical protein